MASRYAGVRSQVWLAGMQESGVGMASRYAGVGSQV